MFSVETMVRGYHVYQDIWDPTLREHLTCKRELGIVGIPLLSLLYYWILLSVIFLERCVCSLFTLRDSIIYFRVTGSRHYSGDLPQGEMEIPSIHINV